MAWLNGEALQIRQPLMRCDEHADVQQGNLGTAAYWSLALLVLRCEMSATCPGAQFLSPCCRLFSGMRTVHSFCRKEWCATVCPP